MILSHNGTKVFAQVNSTTPQSAHATLSINVPFATWGGANKCSPQPSRCIVGASEKTVLFGITKWTKYEAGRSYYKEAVQVSIPRVGYNAAWNTEYVSATLPSAQVYLVAPATSYTRTL